MHRIASLFSGAGGLDLGFAQTGRYEVVFANEVLLHAAATYARNFGLRLEVATEAKLGVVLACDVAQVDFTALRGEVDVVLGGPPCQDFSIVRGPGWERRGIEVRRGRLYEHFLRALAELQPRAFVFENVPGLASANEGLALKAVLEGFEGEGYEVLFSGVVDFSRLGVPQKRERLIVVGVRRGLLRAGDLLVAKERIEGALRGDGLLFSKCPLTPIEVFEGRRLDELGDEYKEAVEKWDGVWLEVGTERAWRWKSEVWDRLTFDVVEDYKVINGVADSELEQALKEHEAVLKELSYYGRPVSELELPDGTHEPPREDPFTVERMKRIPFGENHEFVRGTRWEVKSFVSLFYRRLHPLRPAYTVVAYGGGGTHGYHYGRDRATLTLRERARLQTFPDSFLFTGTRAQIRAQIGEAVPPLAAKRLALALAEVLDELEQ